MSKRILDIILLEEPELLESVWSPDSIQCAQTEYKKLLKELELLREFKWMYDELNK